MTEKADWDAEELLLQKLILSAAKIYYFLLKIQKLLLDFKVKCT